MICLGNCIDILLEWLSYLHEMVRKLEQNHGHPCVRTEPQNHGHPCVFPIARIISTIEQLTKISGNVFPNIIFWNPLIQFPQFATSINRCVAVIMRRELAGSSKQSLKSVFH